MVQLSQFIQKNRVSAYKSIKKFFKVLIRVLKQLQQFIHGLYHCCDMSTGTE